MYLFYLMVILFRPLRLGSLEMEVSKMDRKLMLDVAKQMRKLADSIEALSTEENVKVSESVEKATSLEDVRAVLAKISQYGLTAEVKRSEERRVGKECRS